MHKALVGFIFSLISTMVITIAIVLIVEPKYIIEGIDTERQDYSFYLHEKGTEEVVQKTNNSFSNLQPIIKISEHWFYIKDDHTLQSTNETNRTVGYSAYVMKDYFREVHDTFWNLIYQTYQRFYLFLALLPIGLGILIPAYAHGYFTREIKKTQLGFTSPLRYTLSFIAVFGLLFIGFLLILLPFAIPVYILGLWTIALSYAIKVAAANLLKKL